MIHNAQKRNHRILRLRGILSGIVNLIPAEANISEEEKAQFQLTADKILSELDRIRVKRYACEACKKENWKVTKAKRANRCDICGYYMSDKFYIINKG